MPRPSRALGDERGQEHGHGDVSTLEAAVVPEILLGLLDVAPAPPEQPAAEAGWLVVRVERKRLGIELLSVGVVAVPERRVGEPAGRADRQLDRHAPDARRVALQVRAEVVERGRGRGVQAGHQVIPHPHPTPFTLCT